MTTDDIHTCCYRAHVLIGWKLCEKVISAVCFCLVLCVLGYTYKNIVCNVYIYIYSTFIMFCLTSYMFFLNKQKNRVERKEGRRKKNQNEEGCEGQDEVEKDTGGKLV